MLKVFIKIKGHCVLWQIKNPPFANPSLPFFKVRCFKVNSADICVHVRLERTWGPYLYVSPRAAIQMGTQQNLSWWDVVDNLWERNTWLDPIATFLSLPPDEVTLEKNKGQRNGVDIHNKTKFLHWGSESQGGLHLKTVAEWTDAHRCHREGWRRHHLESHNSFLINDSLQKTPLENEATVM